MKKALLYSFIVFSSFSFSQTFPINYFVLTKSAQDHYNNRGYDKAIKDYTEAFKLIGGRGLEADRYNAAKSWIMLNTPDSAFSILFTMAGRNRGLDTMDIFKDTVLYRLHYYKKWEPLITLMRKNTLLLKNEIRPLKKILDSAYVQDQKYRNELDMIEKKFGLKSKEVKDQWRIIGIHDSLNEIEVTKIIDKYGWLSSWEIGNDANAALFLVIQHADLKTQEKYLPVMRAAAKDLKLKASSLALLEDRVLIRTGKKQIYGSQINSNDKGEYSLYPIEDEKNVNKRRSDVGLQPIEEYVKHWNLTYIPPKD